MTKQERFARAAIEFLDTPFRLHGRDPRTGLDCVGLLLASLEAVGNRSALPQGYGLRNRSADRWLALAPQWGLFDADGAILAGDVLVTRPGALQHHIMIAQSNRSVVHAHAGLRRVVCEPLSDEIKVVRHWRLSDENLRK